MGFTAWWMNVVSLLTRVAEQFARGSRYQCSTFKNRNTYLPSGRGFTHFIVRVFVAGKKRPYALPVSGWVPAMEAGTCAMWRELLLSRARRPARRNRESRGPQPEVCPFVVGSRLVLGVLTLE